VPGTLRIELDRNKGDFTLRTRSWLLGRVRHLQFPLKQIREVSLHALGEDIPPSMTLRMSDGRLVELPNAAKQTDAAAARAAIEAFLQATSSGYR
jgi:hypothetical protein